MSDRARWFLAVSRTVCLLVVWGWCRRGLVAGEGVGEGLLDGCGPDVEEVGDLGAVDDERFGELVLHLEQLPHGGVGHGDQAQEQRRQLTDPAGGRAGELVGEFAQLAGGAGVGVVGEVPHLPGGVGVFAEDGEAFADVGDVGVGVGLVGVAEDAWRSSRPALRGTAGRRGWTGHRRAARSSPRRVRSRPPPGRPGGRRAARAAIRARSFPFLVCAA